MIFSFMMELQQMRVWQATVNDKGRAWVAEHLSWYKEQGQWVIRLWVILIQSTSVTSHDTLTPATWQRNHRIQESDWKSWTRILFLFWGAGLASTQLFWSNLYHIVLNRSEPAYFIRQNACQLPSVHLQQKHTQNSCAFLSSFNATHYRLRIV